MWPIVMIIRVFSAFTFLCNYGPILIALKQKKKKILKTLIISLRKMVISKLKRKTHYCNDTLDVKCAYLSCKWYNTKKDLVRYSSGEIAALKNIMSPLCRFWEEDFFEKIMNLTVPQDKCDAERYPQTCHELFKTICYRTGAEKGSRDILGFSASVHAKSLIPFPSRFFCMNVL